jgi:phosphatidate cytidylyltransferase
VLKQRLITAAGLIVLILWGIFFLPTSYFSTLIGFFVTLGAWEWASLVKLNAVWQRLLTCTGLVLIMILTWIAVHYFGGLIHIILVLAALWWLVCLFWLVRHPYQIVFSAQPAFIRVMVGWLVLLPPWVAMTTLHGNEHYGPIYVLFLLLLTTIADSGAYFSGRAWGKNKLAPQISPGKTWEGVVGAAVSVGVFSTLAGLLLFKMGSGDLLIFVTICLITLVFSIVGDLVESIVKRQVDVKDSGHILPGHGGILDRVDSITAAAPIFVWGVLLTRIPH